MATAAPGVSTTTAGRGPRVLLLLCTLLNLVPAAAHALLSFFMIAPGQYSLVAGTGSLAAVFCTLYALRVASLRRPLVLLLGGVTVLAAGLFIGGEMVVRAMPVESIGPGLIPLMGMLLHLSAAATLFTAALVHQRRKAAARPR